MPKKRPPARALPPTNAPPWLPELLEWEQAPYDGIKGRPPSWISEPVMGEFNRARISLFFLVEKQQGHYEEIRERFDYLIARKYARIGLALLRDNKPYDDALDFLVRIYKAVQLGPEQGVEKLSGKDAVSGYRSRVASRNRGDYAEKREVQAIGRELWGKDSSLSIAAIERAPEMRIYKRRYTGRHTLRDWLKEIDPHPELRRRGRPRHSS
ncbi:MAG: hypothetical protein OEU68_08235 [Nitrospira sp.]|nr:hypothetical protein [Nitrospira sp.]MDH4243530.1 hypothetical protein [Nitrospira sp.]MDH4355587.1 hypothetical protein [Nitrospira sp.]MDH5318079.1 hypothetical protein [Nitrospira sp.]